MKIMEKFFLDRQQAVLVVIDVQEKLCAAMDPEVLERLTKNTGILLEAAQELGMPVVATEQYAKGLGCTLPVLKEKIGGDACEKMTFSCCGDEAFLNRLAALGRKQVIITGMETHVCVLQTVIELLERGYHVHLVRDAIMSRRKENWFVGMEVARDAGAVITSTETALFQLLRVAGTDEFKKLSKLVR
ncbi:hydrolase [Geobacter anodireducens]|uniref:Hydrolase n=1 Tax=Geobacter anodireducens TaxID=1340425 RepID=A0ABR9NS11_9BACT|nr:hydrolase [Geobacter anodireducens]MBE2887051.1 hydrolase [Geobacter anodireducens]HMN03482.1 hydrolase [Geobacter anodireducens]